MIDKTPVRPSTKNAAGPARLSPLDQNNGFDSDSFNEIRSAIANTHTHNSSISTTSKLPVSELESVTFARLNIDWHQTDYISQVIDAQKTGLCAYENARRTSKGVESATTKSASEKALLLGKLVSHTEALRRQLDNLAVKYAPSSPAFPSSQDILNNVMTIYPGCHVVNLKNMHRLSADTVESHISMYGDLQLQLVSAVTTASKKIAEMKHQQAYGTPTTVMAVEKNNMQKDYMTPLAAEIGENVPQHRHDLFRDLPALMGSKSDKLMTTPQAITAAFEQTSPDVTSVTEFRDYHQQSQISADGAYQSLLDEDNQECSVSRGSFQLERPATCLELALANKLYRHWCRHYPHLSHYEKCRRRQ